MSKDVGGDYPDIALPWLTYELDGIDPAVDWRTVIPTLFELLQRLIPCDEIVWNGVDFRTGQAFVVVSADHPYDPEVTRLLVELDDHPVINAYMSAGPVRHLEAVRLSDLTDDLAFRRTRTWGDLFAPRGVRYQITVPTAGDLSQHGNGWSVNRTSGSDFTDIELQLLNSLQPLLASLERAGRWRVDDMTAGAWTLTPRELDVLRLMADGLTARSIAHRLRVSPATVRKHLEHMYEKSGQHDRLMLVQQAQRAGILHPALAVSLARTSNSQ